MKGVSAEAATPNGRVSPDDTITLFGMSTSANTWSVLRGVRQGSCGRRDGVNRQIGSPLSVSSSRFHAAWIYGEFTVHRDEPGVPPGASIGESAAPPTPDYTANTVL